MYWNTPRCYSSTLTRPLFSCTNDPKPFNRPAYSLYVCKSFKFQQEGNLSHQTEDRLTTLHRISQTFNSSLDLEEVLSRVMDEVIKITHGERGFLMLCEPDGSMSFKAARGLDQQTIESPEFQISRGVVERVANEGKSILTSDAQTDEWLRSRESVRALNLRAVLAVPIRLKEECKGVIYVDNRIQTGIFRPADIELLEGIASSAAIAIENARLYQLAVEKGRLERELQVARDVQSNLIPRTTPQIPGWDFAALWKPARQVSGDFFDFIHLQQGKIGIVIADVTDKGMPAALFMAHARSIIRASVLGPYSPAEAIALANHLICTDPTGGMFVSLFYAQLDPAKNELIFVNAGHNPPLHYRSTSNELIELPRAGFPLGIEDKTTYEQGHMNFQNGDFLLMYTDGVTEATNQTYKLFGKDRLSQTLLDSNLASAQEIQSAINNAVFRFIGSNEPSDDITLVVLKKNKNLS
jgi:serine phosphatase RsbU (regulator of sigma subunit)